MPYSLDCPVPFQGTKEQAEENRKSHAWYYEEDEVYCDNCCSQSWHKSASYPCGEKPPRMFIVNCDDGSQYTLYQGEEIPPTWPAEIQRMAAETVAIWGCLIPA